MNFKNFEESQKYLNSFIHSNLKKVFDEKNPLERTRFLAKKIGNPEKKLKIIHIAGTSGKGSTSKLISEALISQGFKVGLIISPHLKTVRERIQINSNPISESNFVNILSDISDFIEETKEVFGNASYFEILAIMAFKYFADQKVDYAVIETGLGGLWDSTNITNNQDKVCIITSIGLDHTEILGDTKQKIAWQKAGIIHPKNILITHYDKEVSDVFHKKIKEIEGSKIYEIQKTDWEISNLSLDGVTLGIASTYSQSQQEKQKLILQNKDFQIKLKTNMVGDFQAKNLVLAFHALQHLSIRDGFQIDFQKLDYKLNKVDFPGRFQILQKNPVLVLDGAHNPQKMEAILDQFCNLGVEKKPLPDSFKSKKTSSATKINLIVAIKKGKDAGGMLDFLPNLIHKYNLKINLILSEYNVSQDMRNQSFTMEELEKAIPESLKCSQNLEIIKESSIQNLTKKYILKPQKPTLVTGSLYFLSEIYPFLDNPSD